LTYDDPKTHSTSLTAHATVDIYCGLFDAEAYPLAYIGNLAPVHIKE